MTEVNNGVQNKPRGPKRSLLDYSLVACFTLVVLLGILVLDAFEYISIPGKDGVKNGIKAMGVGGTVDTSELQEIQKQIAEAREALKEEQSKVKELVEKVEEEIVEEKKEEEGTPAVALTAEEKLEEEKKKEAVVKAVVDGQLGIDKFCPGCRYKAMNFNCGERVNWMMTAYKITREVAMESVINSCHTRLRRGRVLN